MSESALREKLAILEESIIDLSGIVETLEESIAKMNRPQSKQSQMLYGPCIGYVVDTIDPLKAGRVRFFSPFLHEPETLIADLPFARQVSSLGGHDDCGMTWIPPAGSTILIVHENGDRKSPLYLGTTCHHDRGPSGEDLPYPIREYKALFCDRGEGYLVGKTDGSQAFHPWNTENYNGYDMTSENQIEEDIDAQRKITYPNIYGWKTPGKHWWKAVDGDYRCQNRWKRMEMGSACGGGWLLFKDDWLHPSGQWANPKACKAGSLSDECLDTSFLEEEQIRGVQDEFGDFLGSLPGDCIQNPKAPVCRTSPPDEAECANPYFKRLEECRPYRGANNPQRNRVKLAQSGFHLQSRSGHVFCGDDKVEQPSGKKVRWQDEFNFGCTDKFLGKTYWLSATGHLIELNDSEETSRFRGPENGIKAKTAAGHEFKMIDHTLSGCTAGNLREITLKSTANHALIMHDETNEQCSPERREGGIPRAKSKKAWVMLRSGYGLVIYLDDDTTQEETANQSITLLAPRKDGPPNPGLNPGGIAAAQGIPVPTNPDCKQGHLIRMQLNKDDGGFIVTSSGGYYVCASVKDHITEVGREGCDANKINAVFGHYIIVAKKMYVCQSETEIHIADKYIILGAGKDCPPPGSAEAAEEQAQSALANAQNNVAAAQAGQEPAQAGPCFFPIIVAKCPRVCPFTGFVHWTQESMSDRVIASSSQQACSADKKVKNTDNNNNSSELSLDAAAAKIAAEDPGKWTAATARAALAQGQTIVTPNGTYKIS